MRSLDNTGDISQVLVGTTLTIIDELTKYHIFRCSDITTDARRKVDFDSAGKLYFTPRRRTGKHEIDFVSPLRMNYLEWARKCNSFLHDSSTDIKLIDRKNSKQLRRGSEVELDNDINVLGKASFAPNSAGNIPITA